MCPCFFVEPYAFGCAPIFAASYYAQGKRPVDTDNFMAKLGEAVHNLHSLRLAYNDVDLNNVMLDKAGGPVLINFGSCRPFEGRLMQTRAMGWCDGPIHFSDKGHDDLALGNMLSIILPLLVLRVMLFEGMVLI